MPNPSELQRQDDTEPVGTGHTMPIGVGCPSCRHLWEEVCRLTQKYNRLWAVISEVHRQHADDLCWMPADVDNIFVAVGLPPQDLRVGDKEAMRRNCDRYIECLEAGGPWKSYAELEAELQVAKAERDRLREALRPFAEYASRVDLSADGRNPIGDACPPVGGYVNSRETNARPVPTIGNCRRAREALGWEKPHAEETIQRPKHS